VAWGHELSEPSYTLEYAVTEDLPKAFETMFGKVEWTEHTAPGAPV